MSELELELRESAAMSAAASELEELLEGDLSTAATSVCKYTTLGGRPSHIARLTRTASQLQDYALPVTRNTENIIIIVKLRQGSGKDRQGMVKGERP